MKFNCECDYCKHKSYIWSINKKIIWIEIPKNGSYNIKTIKFNFDSELNNLNDTILSEETLETISNFKRGFVVLRNPYDRFKSLISHYFINGSRAKKGFGNEWLEKNNIITDGNNLVDLVLNNFEKIQNIEEPHHFNTQFSFIPANFYNLNNLYLDIFELSLFLSLNDNVNSSPSNDLILTDTQKEKIYKIYKDDFILYEKYIGFV